MVEFKGVSKTYNKSFEALKNIDLSIKKGEFVFVVGASGAGKSTFLKLIMREEVPTSGTVTINGYDLNRMKKRDIPYFRRTMGIVFQDFRLIPDMRVYDNVAFALRVTGTKEREVRKRVTHALGMVGLLSKTQSLPKELSGGEQQRAAIARALVNNADLIIADEPTGNIDPAMSIEILDLLNHINKANGTTVVMVTHAHELVRQYDHRIVMLRDGEIVADGYDKNKILSLANPEILSADAGFYNAPNEYDDVEKFIFTYGKKNAPVEETIPTAPDALKSESAQSANVQSVQNTEKEDDKLAANASSKEVIESIISEVTSGAPSENKNEEKNSKKDNNNTDNKDGSNADGAKNNAGSSYSVKDDEEINSILAAFAASNASRLKKAAEATSGADNSAVSEADGKSKNDKSEVNAENTNTSEHSENSEHSEHTAETSAPSVNTDNNSESAQTRKDGGAL